MSPTSPSSMKKSPHMPLTLIVAATPALGIGVNGALPWRIKSEIQYFARVTTRVPASIAAKYPTSKVQNAVIMGRKTWESIPRKFRPLKGRVNVVLSSNTEASAEGAVWASSLREAVQTLHKMRVEQTGTEGHGQEQDDSTLAQVARIFVIGGGTVYKAALEMPETERVLLTKIQGDHWGCDTFFPVMLEGEEGARAGWKRSSDQELREWVGEDVPEGMVKEGDVEFEYCMFEKENGT